MIVKHFTVAALLLAAACSKAPSEDVTAHYSAKGGTLTVKASAAGDGRIEAGGQVLMHKNGVDYMIMGDGNEKVAVSFADFAAANDRLMRESGAKPRPLENDIDYDVTQVGDETIAGQKGTIWNVAPKDGTPGASARVVIADDHSLDNVGKVLSARTRLQMESMKQLTGSVPKSSTAMQSVLDKGMPLRIGDFLELQDVAKAPVPAADFALPKVLDKDTVYKRLAEQRAKLLKEAAKAGAGDSTAAPAPAPAK